MGTSIAPRGRMTLEHGLAITRQVEFRALDLMGTLRSEGLGPFTSIMNALWQLQRECQIAAEFSNYALSDPEFLDTGIHISATGVWLGMIDLEASCPRVFPPFVVRAPLWLGQIESQFGLGKFGL